MIALDETAPAAVGRPVLILWVDESELETLQAMREYIVSCMRAGVLVLPEASDLEVRELPALAGIEVRPQATPEADPEAAPSGGAVRGRNREEKLALLEQMRAYRRAHGLGCWAAVAQAAGGCVTDELLRDMLLGKASPPIADWRRIKKALDRLEGRMGGNDGTTDVEAQP